MNRNLLRRRNREYLALVLIIASLSVLARATSQEVFAVSYFQDPYPAPGSENGYYPSPELNNSPVEAAPQGIKGEELGIPLEFTVYNQPETGAGSSGLLILWLGFFATLLILFAAIIGSILLFTRRNDT